MVHKAQHNTPKIGKIFYWLLLLIPISFYCAYVLHNMTWTFITAILAIIPLSRIIGYATNELTLQSNPAFGGIINATFGNIIELSIAILALSHGLIRVVQASIIGSIIGNILLLIGLSVLFGGLAYKEQRFNRTSAGVSSTMLIIAVAGLAIPTFYALATGAGHSQIKILSYSVAIVLALTYIASIIFSFYTHKHLFTATDEIRADKEVPSMSIKGALIILFFTTVFAFFEAELVVKAIEPAAQVIGMTQTFIGIVIIAIVANIAEKANAIHFAIENKLDISMEIGLSSAIQIALFVVPILVFVSGAFDYGFSLVFSMFEIVTVMFAVLIVSYLASDGKCNWLEGIQLLAMYLIIAIAFYFV